MIHLKHGAGDREGGYNPKHRGVRPDPGQRPQGQAAADRTRARAPTTTIAVVGYAKFELVAARQRRLFADDRPVALYNPHFEPRGVDAGSPTAERMVARDGAPSPGWNFVVAPHVKLKGGPVVVERRANVRIDRGSVALDRHELHRGGGRLHRRRQQPGLRIHAPSRGRASSSTSTASSGAAIERLRPLARSAR